ncbi:hypothetical protein HJFPF1_12591 [Paramyrothecium foliicola]|nr:hypothetical protein HJFPF1_12591 [Paramyrothecium foliicola]
MLDVLPVEAISWKVRSGFYTSDEIVEEVVYNVSHEFPGLPEKEVRRAVRCHVAAEWATQLERQRSWPATITSSDKVLKAFDSLERNHKILARLNFTCCQTCGIEELQEESEDDSHGYVFFHHQDTENVVSTGNLHLCFGSFTKSERKNQQVGNTIVKSLRRAGLGVEWAGDTDRRIVVRCGEWRRKLREDEEVEDIEDDNFDPDDISSLESDADTEPDTYSDLNMDAEVNLL